jgi:hypothetical protein
MAEPASSPASYSGAEVAVTVPECPPPTVATGEASGVTQTSATLNATVNPNESAVTDCHFELGASTAYGTTLPCSGALGAGTTAVPVSALVAGLLAGTTYHYRVVATGVGGTMAGGDQVLTTVAGPPPPPPPAPVNLIAPAIGGLSVAGYEVTATEGVWEHKPTQYAYQWQLCDASGNACADIAGATGARLPLGSSAVGHRLRVRVKATNSGGSGEALSGATAPVGSKVASSLEWEFVSIGSSTIVKEMNALGVPSGGAVEVACRGHGCPFALAHATSGHRACSRKSHKCHGKTNAGLVQLAPLFKNRRLAAGTVVSVRIVKPNWVGRGYVFKMRAGRPPKHQAACLAPGSTAQGVGC